MLIALINLRKLPHGGLRVTVGQMFLKAESHMALGQYELSIHTLSEMKSSPSVEARKNSILTIDERQMNSIF